VASQPQLPRASSPSQNVPTQPPITLVEFLKRAAEENLTNLLKETEGIQSQAELQDNRTPVMEPESPSQTKSSSSDNASHDSSLDHGIPADERQSSSTQHPRAGRRKSPRYK
jgi:hypothetical protein